MNKRTLLFIGLGALALVAVGWLAYTPYAASKQIETALAKADPQELGDVLDLDAVQAHYRAQLKTELDQALAQNDLSNPLLILGPAMGEMMVERRARELSERPSILKTIAAGTPTMATPGLPLNLPANPLQEASRGYIGLNRFAITTQGATPVKIVLHREGLIHWKASEILLPPPAQPVVARQAP